MQKIHAAILVGASLALTCSAAIADPPPPRDVQIGPDRWELPLSPASEWDRDSYGAFPNHVGFDGFPAGQVQCEQQADLIMADMAFARLHPSEQGDFDMRDAIAYAPFRRWTEVRCSQYYHSLGPVPASGTTISTNNYEQTKTYVHPWVMEGRLTPYAPANYSGIWKPSIFDGSFDTQTSLNAKFTVTILVKRDNTITGNAEIVQGNSIYNALLRGEMDGDFLHVIYEQPGTHGSGQVIFAMSADHSKIIGFGVDDAPGNMRFTWNGTRRGTPMGDYRH